MGDIHKPERLYAKTLLQMIRNSVGTAMFKSFYIRTPERGEFDALGGGDNSCAFYVSSVLVIFKLIGSAHATVDSLIMDLERSGWRVVEPQENAEPRPCDVIVWEAVDAPDGRYEHVGFYIGNRRAISTSYASKVVAEHDLHFGDMQRPIKQIFRFQIPAPEHVSS
jgi:hypothetical protein